VSFARTSTEPPAASGSASALLPALIVAPLPICASVVLTMTFAASVPLTADSSAFPPEAASSIARSSVSAVTFRLSA
jgi:hypothetical protein